MADFNQNQGPVGDRPVQQRIAIPDRVGSGVLADFASIWRTDGYFVLDFIAQQTPLREEPVGPNPNGPTQLVVDSAVVSRVKILPSQILPLIKAMQEQSDSWIEEQGKNLGVD